MKLFSIMAALLLTTSMSLAMQEDAKDDMSSSAPNTGQTSSPSSSSNEASSSKDKGKEKELSFEAALRAVSAHLDSIKPEKGSTDKGAWQLYNHGLDDFKKVELCAKVMNTIAMVVKEAQEKAEGILKIEDLRFEPLSEFSKLIAGSLNEKTDEEVLNHLGSVKQIFPETPSHKGSVSVTGFRVSNGETVHILAVPVATPFNEALNLWREKSKLMANHERLSSKEESSGDDMESSSISTASDDNAQAIKNLEKRIQETNVKMHAAFETIQKNLNAMLDVNLLKAELDAVKVMEALFPEVFPKEETKD